MHQPLEACTAVSLLLRLRRRGLVLNSQEKLIQFAMSFQEINLDPAQFLAALNDNLNNRFYAQSRSNAKILFQQLLEGEAQPFMRIGVADSGDIVCDLLLDHSEHVGKISFSQFRKALAMMMLNIKERVDAQRPLNLMTSENGEILFNIPGVLQGADATNVMVCGVAQSGPGRATAKLMYLNPESYVQAAAATATSASSDTAPR